MDKILKLIEFTKIDPKDPFAFYALALEYQKLDTIEAQKYYDHLLEQFPNYLPTYFHAAEYFASKEQLDKAEKIYTEGIALALKLKDSHALAELKNAFQNFQIENDRF
ncbi:MAG: tetratricopeptide repeat protein [Cyclobacteriaceae bacterium]|nr:tetratricopeptide repeat protein [Cyclobacteriaceae bacterium]MCH8516475.1 tetratricopeptide repeat protein [Cyclobacteriaceae bacterium]